MNRNFGFALVFLIAIGILGYIVWKAPGDASNRLGLATGYATLILVFGSGLVVLLAIVTGQIDISGLISEIGGGASMSRFQLLIFTFVVAMSLFLIVASTGKFPDKIPGEVLTLLGISSTTYAVSKGIQASMNSAPSSPPTTASATTTTSTSTSVKGTAVRQDTQVNTE